MLQIKDEKMSDDDADDFIAFGKALKPLEDDAIIRKKPIAVEEQIGNISLFPTSYSRLCSVPLRKSLFQAAIKQNRPLHYSSRPEWHQTFPRGFHRGLVGGPL